MTLPLERWGAGATPALFLHGFTGRRTSWRHLQPLLGDELRATCVDLPGHGDAPPPAEGTRGFLATVDLLAALLDEPAVVVGYSQGARLALALAVHYPHKVARLVLESGTPGLHRRADRARRREADETLARRVLEEGVERFVDLWEAKALFSGLRHLPEAERARLRERRASHRAEGLAGALRGLGQGAQPDYWPSLTRVLRPTLVLTGADDRMYTRIGRRMVEDLPLGWRVTFGAVGHAPHLERPEAYAEEVRRFLAARWDADPQAVVP